MGTTSSAEFWDILAAHHRGLEDSFLDLRSLRGFLQAIEQPVLVVGAGHGLLVEELRNKGFQCDGLDLSSAMVRHAQLRRGITLVEANARAMPFENATYQTIIYATGVIDFIGDEDEIRLILNEGRRVVTPGGKIFVAFYRASAAQEQFLEKVGLLQNNILFHRQSLELYLLNPVQMVAWVAKRAKIGTMRAFAMMLRLTALTTIHEKVITLRMQRIFRDREVAGALIKAAPEQLPYRNHAEIENLFTRLSIPIREVQTFRTCYVIQI